MPRWAEDLATARGPGQPVISLSSERGRLGAVAWEADEDAAMLLASFLGALEAEGYEVKVEHRARDGAGPANLAGSPARTGPGSPNTSRSHPQVPAARCPAPRRRRRGKRRRGPRKYYPASVPPGSRGVERRRACRCRPDVPWSSSITWGRRSRGPSAPKAVWRAAAASGRRARSGQQPAADPGGRADSSTGCSARPAGHGAVQAHRARAGGMRDRGHPRLSGIGWLRQAASPGPGPDVRRTFRPVHAGSVRCTAPMGVGGRGLVPTITG
jgi:hypothetical protein